MVWLDTNAFYYLSELSLHGPVGSACIEKSLENKEVALSAYAFNEFIMHFKNDEVALRKGLGFIVEHCINIVDDTGNVLEINDIDGFISILPDWLTSIKKAKVEIESPFAAAIFIISMQCGLYFYACSDSTEPNEIEYDVINIASNKRFRDIFVDVMKSIYLDAYDSDNAENDIRLSFHNLLGFVLSLFIPIVDAASELTDTRVTLTDILGDPNLTIEQESIMARIKQQGRTPSQYLNKIAIKYWKNVNDSHLSAFLSQIDPILEKKFADCPPVKEYIHDILWRVLLEGGAFRKNDILDSFILNRVQNNDVLLTFDGGLIDHMKKYISTSTIYQDSVNYIAQVMSSDC